MFQSIFIDNFKSLVNFHLPEKGAEEKNPQLGKLVTFIGLNGAGKTTLLQALDFLSQLVKGKVGEWIKKRGWKPQDLLWSGEKTHGQSKRNRSTITFDLQFFFEDIGHMRWSGIYHLKKKKCIRERLFVNGEIRLLPSPDMYLMIEAKGDPSRAFHPNALQYEGSILSIFESGEAIKTLRHFMLNLKSGRGLNTAMLPQSYSQDPCILFEEIENGINPELVERLVEFLRQIPKQVMFTTHSPLLLNYFTDDEAKASVFLIYKTEEGVTRSAPFFQIPEILEKLEVMGPGEAFLDSDLEFVLDELNRKVQEAR